jgi:hypothetical protein
MKSEEWKSYRTRFLVNAKQLNSSLSFVDHLGRKHCGHKGDYLVESSDGVISIAPRRIFEDIYVPMSQPEQSGGQSSVGVPNFNLASTDRLKFEALAIEQVKLRKSPVGHQPIDPIVPGRNAEAIAVRGKLPQSCRERRGSTEHLRLM